MGDGPVDEAAGVSPGYPERSWSAGDVTLRSYEQAADLYRDAYSSPRREFTAFLDTFANLVSPSEVLELGSGTGRDATYLSQRGLRVLPTDGAQSFVDMMNREGLHARLLDVRTGDFGGPWRGVLAIAALVHLSRPDFSAFLDRVAESMTGDGVLGFTLKEGDGDGWSFEKLGLPRHFTYWREPDLRAELAATGWSVRLLQQVDSPHEPWLFVVVTRAVRQEGPGVGDPNSRR